VTEQRLADEMAQTYQWMLSLEGIHCKITPRDERQFLKMARKCIDHAVDGKVYVGWAVDFYRQRGTPAFVNRICSDQVFSQFITERAAHKPPTKLRVELQLGMVQDELIRGRTPEQIIGDSELELGVVVRYAVAYASGLTEWVERLRVDAEYNMSINPDYRSLLVSFFNNDAETEND
jgi:hypothetical protein